jgi:hypothetical protein
LLDPRPNFSVEIVDGKENIVGNPYDGEDQKN